MIIYTLSFISGLLRSTYLMHAARRNEDVVASLRLSAQNILKSKEQQKRKKATAKAVETWLRGLSTEWVLSCIATQYLNDRVMKVDWICWVSVLKRTSSLNFVSGASQEFHVSSGEF